MFLSQKNFLLLTSSLLPIFVACGSGTNNHIVKEANISEINSSLVQIETETETEAEVEAEIEIDDEIETPPIATTIKDINYTDEEITLTADASYARNSSSDRSAQISSLIFKGGLPVENNIAMVKENSEFSFELNWNNSLYVQNVSYYFFNGRQTYVQYRTISLADFSSSYSGSCQALEGYTFTCDGFFLDESANYEGEELPTRSSFVMALCDKGTTDPQRVCDFIRIPIEFRE